MVFRDRERVNLPALGETTRRGASVGQERSFVGPAQQAGATYWGLEVRKQKERQGCPGAQWVGTVGS